MSIICRFSFSRISSSLSTPPLLLFFPSLFCSRSLSLSLSCCISCFVSLSCRPYLVLCVSLLSRLCVFRYSILLLPTTTTRISFRFVCFWFFFLLFERLSICVCESYWFPPPSTPSPSCRRLWLVTLVHERMWSFPSGPSPVLSFFLFALTRFVLFYFVSLLFFCSAIDIFFFFLFWPSWDLLFCM